LFGCDLEKKRTSQDGDAFCEIIPRLVKEK
jgi:hypothetical protein